MEIQNWHNPNFRNWNKKLKMHQQKLPIKRLFEKKMYIFWSGFEILLNEFFWRIPLGVAGAAIGVETADCLSLRIFPSEAWFFKNKRMSSLRTLPSLPDPWISVILIPCSLHILRTAGVAKALNFQKIYINHYSKKDTLALNLVWVAKVKANYENCFLFIDTIENWFWFIKIILTSC